KNPDAEPAWISTTMDGHVHGPSMRLAGAEVEPGTIPGESQAASRGTRPQGTCLQPANTCMEMTTTVAKKAPGQVSEPHKLCQSYSVMADQVGVCRHRFFPFPLSPP